MIRREQQPLQNRRRSAFTLMEMLVVVAIIVALAGMGTVYFVGYLNDTKISTAQIQCQNLDNAIQGYATKHREAATSIDQLFQEVDGKSPMIKDERMKTDPWGNPYQWGGGETPVYTTMAKGKITAKGLNKGD